MPKKKAKTFQAGKAVRSMAREVIGTPPPTRRAPDKTKEPAEKHKSTLAQLLQEN